jgi:hypothetical protein
MSLSQQVQIVGLHITPQLGEVGHAHSQPAGYTPASSKSIAPGNIWTHSISIGISIGISISLTHSFYIDIDIDIDIDR